MITKAIVESIVDKYTVKIRIPRIDRVSLTSMNTSAEYLNEALICTLSNCDPNIRVGDIVFVALDDQNEDEAIILGYLYRETRTESYCDLILNELKVINNASLPMETTIGDIQSIELLQLKGIKDNIQEQISHLKEQLEVLQSQVQNLNSNLSAQS